MRKYLWSLAACLLIMSGTFGSTAFGEAPSVTKERNQPQQNQPEQTQPGQTQPGQNQPEQGQPGQDQTQVQLTEAQKNELAKLHKDILEKKKEMIGKYVEYGVIPEDKGQMMITHFEKHYETLEQNGFMLRVPHHHQGEIPKKP